MRLVLPLFCSVAAALWPLPVLAGPALPIVSQVEWQPFTNHVRALIEAADFLGSLLGADKEELLRVLQRTDTASARVRLQEVLDAHCLLGVQIDPEMRVKLAPGPAEPALAERGWRVFLVKIANASGTTATPRILSPQSRSLPESGPGRTESDDYFKLGGATPAGTDQADRWLDLAAYDAPPLTRRLTGLDLEYRVLQLYSHASSRQMARLIFQVGSASPGKDSELEMAFDCAPAQDITIRVRDENDQPATIAMVLRDPQGRLYPPPSKRLAPDLASQPQVYRADGDVLRLAAGAYTVQWSRGPESVPMSRRLEVGQAGGTETFRVERWIDPAQFGWWSGDPHLHAAGCAQDVKPPGGMSASDVLRHMIGEDLKLGVIVTGGASFESQKQSLSGDPDPASQYPHLLRYDFEVAGSGAPDSGHLLVLGPREFTHAAGESTNQRPVLGLDTLRWARKQSAVTGASLGGTGLETKTTDLPNHLIPSFQGAGHEYIVDVTHDFPNSDGTPQPAVDFLGLDAASPLGELNLWYHILNVGFRPRIAGQSAFPCPGADRIGRGRSYVKLEGRLAHAAWYEGLRRGRCYVSDGMSHLLDFKVNSMEVGRDQSELALEGPGPVQITARVAARLSEKPERAPSKRSDTGEPPWDLERARLAQTREVPVEVVVNGQAVARTNLVADGALQDVRFEVALAQSSWVALRILPSSHTNPIFVLVDGKPVRASKRSAEWCLKSVDQCWSEMERFLQKNKLEPENAKAAYDHARSVYRERLKECSTD